MRRAPPMILQNCSQIYEGGLIGEYVDCFAGSEDPVEQKALFYGIEALLDAKREL